MLKNTKQSYHRIATTFEPVNWVFSRLKQNRRPFIDSKSSAFRRVAFSSPSAILRRFSHQAYRLSPRASYASYADSLARRPSDTLLYRSSPTRSFTVGTYIVGLSSVFYGWNAGNILLYHKEGMSLLVQTCYALVCFFMVAVAIWQFQRVRQIPQSEALTNDHQTHLLVKSITAVSSRSSGSKALKLHFACNRLLPIPFLKPRIITADVSAVRMRTHSFHQDIQPSTRDLKQAEKLARIESYSRLRDLPIRWSGYLGLWTSHFARYFVSLFSGEPFIYATTSKLWGIMIIPKKAAWILDGGRPLDRLIKYKV